MFLKGCSDEYTTKIDLYNRANWISQHFNSFNILLALWYFEWKWENQILDGCWWLYNRSFWNKKAYLLGADPANTVKKICIFSGKLCDVIGSTVNLRTIINFLLLRWFLQWVTTVSRICRIELLASTGLWVQRASEILFWGYRITEGEWVQTDYLE